MGQAKIVSGGPAGLYTIELVNETSKVAARLVVIAARLNGSSGDPSYSPPKPVVIGLTAAVETATIAVHAAETALAVAKNGLDGRIQVDKGLGTLTAIPRWYNHGNGTVTKANPGTATRVGRYSMDCIAVVASPKSATFAVYDTFLGSLPDAITGAAYVNAEINFMITLGSVDFLTGDSFDIEVATGAEVPITSQTIYQGRLVAAISDLTNKRRKLSALLLEQTSLLQEQANLQSILVPVSRIGVWCADLTENMEAGKVVGTIEVNGEPSTMLIMPAGAAGLGKLQPTQASSAAAIFVNLAKLACWQKWKPTYRVGQIKNLITLTNQCDVCLDEVHSSAQGLPINQAGTVCAQTLGALYSSFTAFAKANPTHPIITNTSDSTITSSEQLLKDLEEVNADVNSHNKYTKDINPNGTLSDQWNFMQPGGSGDCEDFSLTKLQKLLDKGYPISALKIEAGKTLGGAGHAWLTVQTTAGDLALDINYGKVMPSGYLTYTDRSKQTGTDWKRSGVLLSNVPVEYMSGENAAAFEVNDRVVVAFTGQAWNAPKVIGFESNPKTGAMIYRTQGGVFRTYVRSSGALKSDSLGTPLPVGGGHVGPSFVKGSTIYTLCTFYRPVDLGRDLFKIEIRNKRTGAKLTEINESGAVVAASANSATTFTTNLPSTVNDFYKGASVIISSGVLLGQERDIAGYVGATKTVTLASALTAIPANGVTFTVVRGGFTMPAIYPNVAVYSYPEFIDLGGIYVDAGDRIWVSLFFRTAWAVEFSGLWCYSPAGVLLGAQSGEGTGPFQWSRPGQIAMYQATNGWQIYASDRSNGRFKQISYTNFNAVTLYTLPSAAPFGMYSVAGLVVVGTKLYALLAFDGSLYVGADPIVPVLFHIYDIAPATGNLTFVSSRTLFPGYGDWVNGNALFFGMQYVQGKLYVSRTENGHYLVHRYDLTGTLESTVDIATQTLPQYDEIDVFVG